MTAQAPHQPQWSKVGGNQQPGQDLQIVDQHIDIIVADLRIFQHVRPISSYVR